MGKGLLVCRGDRPLPEAFELQAVKTTHHSFEHLFNTLLRQEHATRTSFPVFENDTLFRSTFARDQRVLAIPKTEHPSEPPDATDSD